MTRKRQQIRSPGEGRLNARPKQQPIHVSGTETRIGLQPLALSTQRDVLLYVPPSYRSDRPAPLLLMLHGAGGHGDHGIGLLRPLADETGLILLVPSSRGRTWDIILGAYGPDVDFINQALTKSFDRVRIDPAQIAVGGFSDGASYALSLGIVNGDLFTHILAFSPGFMAPPEQIGMPRIFISHGTGDTVLPIDRCSRRIVPQLERAGYDLRYVEFEGGHTVPPEIGLEALRWMRDGKTT